MKPLAVRTYAGQATDVVEEFARAGRRRQLVAGNECKGVAVDLGEGWGGGGGGGGIIYSSASALQRFSEVGWGYHDGTGWYTGRGVMRTAGACAAAGPAALPGLRGSCCAGAVLASRWGPLWCGTAWHQEAAMARPSPLWEPLAAPLAPGCSQVQLLGACMGRKGARPLTRAGCPAPFQSTALQPCEFLTTTSTRNWRMTRLQHQGGPGQAGLAGAITSEPLFC